MIEVKNVIGYEGLYIIDNLGNVVSLPKVQGRYVHNKYHVLSEKVNKYGYVEVSLAKDGNVRTFLLHRLIAQHFIPNPDNLPEVNHINGIKSDNRIENLEWVSVSQNMKHAFKNNLSDFQRKSLGALAKINEKNMYARVILEKDGKEYIFNSVREAAVFAGTNRDDITRAIRKHQRTRGFRVFGIKPETEANGEALPCNDGGNPVGSLEIGTCIDYSSEGK